MTDAIVGPTSHWYHSQRLRLHYVDWGNEGAPPLLLVHGMRDHCRSWDWIARALRDEYHVLAPDLRGHGDSQWLVGGSYVQSGFVYDIAQLLHQQDLFPISIVGHSLGGSVVLQYAGLYPEHVRRIVSIEGLGPSPDMIREQSARPPHERLLGWIEQGRELAARPPHRYATIEDAVARMRDANSRLSDEQARHLTTHGMNRNEDGTYSWKFDNYVRGGSPLAFPATDAHQLWARIECPVLLVRGEDSWARDPRSDGRASLFRDAEYVGIKNAGHWVHHDQLDDVLPTIREFLKG
jgi:pimeloyl-ACP methyl ester carboxylesterase